MDDPLVQFLTHDYDSTRIIVLGEDDHCFRTTAEFSKLIQGILVQTVLIHRRSRTDSDLQVQNNFLKYRIL